jgi:hypothetical protein
VVIKENLPVQFCFRHPESLTVAPRHSHGDDAASFQWSLESFSREAATLASLDHPGIVKVLRSFPAFGTAYFVMPFVEGMALDGVIQQREARGERFAEEELLGLLNRLLDALGHLHANGIYHRDIKPGNILITRNGIPVLIDFGSARQLVSERSMTVIESPGYTPFEQLQSRGNVGPWSDLYALAGTLYKAITFETPPKANDRVRHDPARILASDPSLTGRFNRDFLAALDRAFRPDERERWQTAGEWLSVLELPTTGGSSFQVPADSEQSVSASAPSIIGQKRFPWVAVACMTVAIAGGFWLVSNLKERQEKENSRREAEDKAAQIAEDRRQEELKEERRLEAEVKELERRRIQAEESARKAEEVRLAAEAERARLLAEEEVRQAAIAKAAAQADADAKALEKNRAEVAARQAAAEENRRQEKENLADLKGQLATVEAKIASERVRWQEATALINRLTNYKTQPVKIGSGKYYQCQTAAQIIDDVNQGAAALNAEKARLEAMIQELEK